MNTTKRIAIFNGFRFHYEMFGFVLDYLTTNNLPFDIFSETEGDMGWFRVYESRFGSRTIHPIRSFNQYNYDYVFLLTDDDTKYSKRWQHSKVIMFEHTGTRYVMRSVHRRLQLRQYTTRHPPSPEESWILPVWNIGYRDKDPAHIQITAIGNNCPCNPSELLPWFQDIRSVKFTFINRTPSPTIFDHASWTPYTNVTLLENIDAERMLEEASKADWLLLLPKNEHQYQDSISAILPIAYGVGTPILMKQEWLTAYGFGGIQALDPAHPTQKPSAAILEECEAMRDRLFERRDKILEECLRT